MLKINGAWYVNNLPTMLVIELEDNTLTMVNITPLRTIGLSDYHQYKGYHPRKVKGQPLPDYLYRFYGLTKSEESATEVIHIRLTPAEKSKLQTAATNDNKTISEYVREIIRTIK